MIVLLQLGAYLSFIGLYVSGIIYVAGLWIG